MLNILPFWSWSLLGHVGVSPQQLQELAQPACNPNPTQTPKHIRLLSPLVVVVYRQFSATTTTEKKTTPTPPN
jgi:hypothetical protein